MRSLLQKISAMVLALALTLGLGTGVAFAADEVSYEQSVTFTDVAAGDTLTAYRLVEYASDYHSYVFDSDFKKYIRAYQREHAAETQNDLDAEAYFASLSTNETAALINSYVTELRKADAAYSLPTVYTNAVATADSQATLTLDAGYYLVLGTTTTANSKVYVPVTVFVEVDQNASNVYAGGAALVNNTMEEKWEDAPSITKEVKDGENWSSTATAGVGDTVHFRVAVTIPAYSDADTITLALHDVLTNAAYTEGSLSVYADNAMQYPIAGAATVEAGEYTRGRQALTVTLSYDAMVANNRTDTVVYVAYDGVVQADAAATDQTQNAVALAYAIDGDEEETSVEITRVHSFALQMHNQDARANPLDLAKFTFYPSDRADAEAVAFVAVYDRDSLLYYRPAMHADETGAVTELALDADGELLIKGLDAGTYYIKESTVPKGYLPPHGDFVVTLVADTVAEGNDAGTYTGYLRSEDGCTVAVTDTKDTDLISGAVDAADANQYDVVVMNSKMAVLPSTGGMGTALFTVLGVALIVVAVVSLYHIRKRAIVRK